MRIFYRYFAFFCLFTAVLGLFGGCRKTTSRQEFVLNTLCSISLFDEGTTKVYGDVFRRLREIDDRMSVHKPGSDISRINAAAGLEPVQVSPDVFMVIERALFFAEISGGYFDPTVQPLVALWGITGDNPRLPTQDEIDAVLPLINWRDVVIDRENSSVFLAQPGMGLDLGGIAKGYAADEAAAIIRQAGISRAIIDLGGNILVVGERSKQTPWRIGVQDPHQPRGAYVGVISALDQTVVTSGVYERFFEADGIRYHHLFSTSNGYPARTGLLSVTVIGGVSIDADALSTAAFCMGYDQGKILIDSIAGVDAVFVFDDLSIRKTSGADFRLSNDSYKLLLD